MSINVIQIEAIDEHARAIGYVCIYWAALEHGIDSLLQTITPLEPGRISDCITANADIRAKMQMVKALSFARKPTDGWFEHVEEVINRIDNNLRLQRNRFIHDAWVGLEPIKRRTRRTSIKRSQARADPELTTYEDVPVTASEIWQFVQQISEAQVMLSLYQSHYRELTASPPKPA